MDDTPANLSLMADVLDDDYQVRVANSGARALQIAQSAAPPDLILLDVMMPDLDGYEVCRLLKADPATRDIPVIFLTARNDVRDEQLGFELGAADYITKPISPPIVLARVQTHLQAKSFADFLKDKAQYLEGEVHRRTEEVRDVQDVTILMMASLAETRDNETGNHIIRTQHYVKLLAEQLRDHPRFSQYLDDIAIDRLFKSAPLHDIGKVGIADYILLKPGKLTAEEFEIMKTHTTLGKIAIESAEERLGKHVPFLLCAKEIAYISARLMALADVYDALISRRVYKPAFTHEAAMQIIEEGRGRHFDPDIVDAFVQVQFACKAIAEQHANTDEELAKKP